MTDHSLPPGLYRDTLAVRTALERSQYGENSEALFLTSSFVQPDAETSARRFAGTEEGFTYTRTSNPTVASFERRLAALEGDFADGYPTGTGKMTFSTGKMRSYDGEVVNATPQGKGVLTTDDGRLAATFRNGAALAGGTFTSDSTPAGSGGKGLAAKASTPVILSDDCKNTKTFRPLWCSVSN